MITPSAILPDLGGLRPACRSRSRPRPGTGAPALHRRDQLGQLGRQLVALAGRADGRRRRRRSRVAIAADLGAALGRRRRRDQRHQRQAGVAQNASRISSSSSSGRSGTIAPAAPAAARRSANALGAAREHHVRVDHQHHRDPVARPLRRSRATCRSVAPPRERRGRGGVDHRAVGERVGERARRARSGRRRRRRRRRRPPARLAGRGSRPSCTASAPRGPRPWPRRRRRRSVSAPALTTPVCDSETSVLEPLSDLGEVLVAAAGQADEVVAVALGALAFAEQPGDRVARTRAPG